MGKVLELQGVIPGHEEVAANRDPRAEAWRTTLV
jgi:hypothetical protein